MDAFLKQPLFDGKIFWKVDKEIECVDNKNTYYDLEGLLIKELAVSEIDTEVLSWNENGLKSTYNLTKKERRLKYRSAN